MSDDKMVKFNTEKFTGRAYDLSDGRKVGIGNDGENFSCNFVNSAGQELNFALSIEAAQIVVLELFNQLSEIGHGLDVVPKNNNA